MEMVTLTTTVIVTRPPPPPPVGGGVSVKLPPLLSAKSPATLRRFCHMCAKTHPVLHADSVTTPEASIMLTGTTSMELAPFKSSSGYAVASTACIATTAAARIVHSGVSSTLPLCCRANTGKRLMGSR
jgi:hypothetical protein